jgi:glycosyltransferase involved in cell wall biosynthesis
VLQSHDSQHFVSIIVITKNNSTTIEECIASLLNQTCQSKDYEVIFVDGHSSDGTDVTIKKNAEQNDNISMVYESYGRMGYARNVGVSRSVGDIIAFTDGDAFVPKNWVETIMHFFDDEKLTVLGGHDFLVSGTMSNQLIDSWRRLGKSEGVKAIPCIKTVNFAIKRESLMKIGGFDPDLSHWDEAELMARLISTNEDSRILYDPNFSVSHKRSPSPSVRSRVRKVFMKSSDGVAVLMRRHMMRVAAKNPTSSIGLSFLMIPLCILILGLTILSVLANFLLFLFAYSLLLYGILLCVYVVAVFQKTKRFAVQIPLFLTLDFVVRFVGTCFGLAKWFKSSLISNASDRKRLGMR